MARCMNHAARDQQVPLVWDSPIDYDPRNGTIPIPCRITARIMFFGADGRRPRCGCNIMGYNKLSFSFFARRLGSPLAGFRRERSVNDFGDQPIRFPEGKGSPIPIHFGQSVSSGSGSMKKRRKSGFKMPEKTYWHLYSLQTLNPEKFIKVVDKILKKHFILIK